MVSPFKDIYYEDVNYDRRAFNVCWCSLFKKTVANSTQYRWSQMGQGFEAVYYETSDKNMIVLSPIAISNVQAL